MGDRLGIQVAVDSFHFGVHIVERLWTPCSGHGVQIVASRSLCWLSSASYGQHQT